MTSPEEKTCRAEKFLTRHSFWIGLAIVALAMAFGVVLTWRRWPDLIIDFGIQLYLPWRISVGAVLYRDLFYFSGGPFSQYYHALLFKLFGVSFLTLIIANVALVSALLFVIYRRFRGAADTWAATTIGLSIVFVFTFAQYGTVANYNYLAPYSHEALHGLFFSVLAVAWLADWLTQARLRFAAAAGFCAGLVFLTKPDIFLALAACAGAAFFLQGYVLKKTLATAKGLAAFVTAGILPSLGFFLIFLRDENWRDSLRSIVFGWRPLFQPGVLKNPFYQWCLGFDAPETHLRDLIVQSLLVAFVILIFVASLRLLAHLKPKWRCPIFLSLTIFLLLAAAKFNWLGAGYCLPLFCLATCLILRRDFEILAARPATAFPLLWSVFGLVLLLKMGFFPRLWHYGFVLAMPAFVSAVFLLHWRLPRWLEQKWQVPARFFRPAIWLVLMSGFVILFRQSEFFYAAKHLPVGHGVDKILASGPSGNDVEARTMNLALDWIDKNVPARATLAVLPEGTLINYLSRRANPTPDLDWNPTLFPVFGQSNMTAAFEKSPPDYVCLVEWKSYDFGVGYFGREPGYGVELMQWIGKNYEPVFLAGSEPLKNGLFGIKILRRIPPVP